MYNKYKSTTLPRRARRRGSGLFLAFLTEYLLTNPAFPAILPPVNAMMRTSSAAQSCQENPRMVEGGEGGGVNTSLSSGPKRCKPCVGSAGRARYSAGVLSGTSRGRALQRGGESEVVPRAFALCPVGQGALFYWRKECERSGICWKIKYGLQRRWRPISTN